MHWKNQRPFKKCCLRQERCFSLEHVESSKSGPLGIKSGALDQLSKALILAPPLRNITLGELVKLKPHFSCYTMEVMVAHHSLNLFAD